MQPQTHHIQADHVALILALSKSKPCARWKAVSNSFEAGDCGGGWRHCHEYRKYLGIEPAAVPSRITSVWHGYLWRTVRQVQQAHGAQEVKRIWGLGVNALHAELVLQGVQ